MATTGKALLIDDAYKDSRFNRSIDLATGWRTRQILCVPIKNQLAEVIGVVQCINKSTSLMSCFTQEDLQLVDELAWQTSTVLMFKMKRLVQELTRDGSSSGGDDEPENMMGDGIAQLITLMQHPKELVQIRASRALGWVCQAKANRERICKLRQVPVLFELASPRPWSSREALRGVCLSLGYLTISETVREEVAMNRAKWKPLLVHLASNDSEVWFDILRVLANLALHPMMHKPMVDAGVLDHVLRFLPRADPDLQSQAMRLLGNLSPTAVDDLLGLPAATRCTATIAATASRLRPNLRPRPLPVPLIEPCDAHCSCARDVCDETGRGDGGGVHRLSCRHRGPRGLGMP